MSSCCVSLYHQNTLGHDTLNQWGGSQAFALMEFGDSGLGKWAVVSGCAQEQVMGTGQAVLLHSLQAFINLHHYLEG